MRSRKKFVVCPNCDTKLSEKDHFCSHCGQQNHDLKIPFWHLVEEGIESFFHVDRKALLTLKYLIFSPGKLSKEYNEGRRVKYIPPIRLYVIISFLFFFLLNMYAPHELAKEQGKGGISLNFYGIATNELDGLSKTQLDSLINARGIERTEFRLYMIDKLYVLANSNTSNFFHSVLKNISYMMFVLMPGFALILYVFFLNKNRYYVESLFVSIHFHSFVFLLISFFLLVGLTKTIFAILLTPIIVPVYLYFILREYYSQKVFAAVWKTFAIGFLHFFLLAIFTVLTIIVSLYMS